MSFVAGLCFSSTGVDLFDTYSTEIFEAFGLNPSSAQLSSILFNLAGLVAAVGIIFTVDLVPRRKLLLTTLWTCFLVAGLILVLWMARLVWGKNQTLGMLSVVALSISTFSYGLGRTIFQLLSIVNF